MGGCISVSNKAELNAALKIYYEGITSEHEEISAALLFR
jgi:hypothetical protein